MKTAQKQSHDIRNDFPALAGGLCYLDSAASAQKPRAVINAMTRAMEERYANVHRGIYDAAAHTSAAFEAARDKVARFLNAASSREIVFTRGATEGINLVAATLGIGPGDEIVLTELEHHANIVPWVMTGASLRIVPVLENGALDMAAFGKMLSPKTKMVAVTQMSNALGTVTPAREIVSKAKAAGALTLIDGAQGITHLHTDVRDLGCDFYAFSGHKLYGPTGIGVLYGREEVLAGMPPYQGGGEMIESVAFDKVTYKAPPHRFEAGTPAIVEAIGLGAAVDYFLGLGDIGAHEAALLAKAEAALSAMKGVTIYSRAPERAAILSFNVDGAHPHDVATLLDQQGIAVRAGHHCCQPLMKALGVTATLRASFAAYSTEEDVERLIAGLEKAQRMLKS